VQVSPASNNSTPQQSPALGLKAPQDDNDYVIDMKDDDIGEGSFACVKLGKKISTGETVAVKMIEKKTIPNEMRTLIERECHILEKLHHKVHYNLFDY
tara:strand:+ start:225 stop:518 length:294 start_codon:yes stop_codon:yes gene_type:complete